MSTIIKIRRDTEYNWQNINPVLHNGEIVIVIREDGSRYVKIGDGQNSFNNLPIFAGNINNA